MSRHKALNIVLVGDSKVGKSTLISICHIQNPILDDKGIPTYRRQFESSKTYSPTSFKSYRTDVRLRGYYSMPHTTKRVFQTNIIDVGGSRRYDDVRPLAYMNCNVFLLCFDLTNRASLESVQSRWLPEIRHYEPQTPIILIGNKADLKTERKVLAGKEVQKLSKTLGLDRYIEISCYDDENVYALFSIALELAYEHQKKKSESTKEQVVEFDVNELDSLSDPPEFTKKGSTTLCDDWQKTLNSRRLTDVILRFPGDSADIHAHKFILYLASGTFKKLLRNVTSWEKTMQKDPLQSSEIKKLLVTPLSKGTHHMYPCETCERKTCYCVPKGDNIMAGMSIEPEQEFSKNFTYRATNFLCKVDGHQLEIAFDKSIDYTAFVCILKWMYTGVLNIPDKLDDIFVINLYHVIFELEILPLKTLCYNLLRHKGKAKNLIQMDESGQETLQDDENLHVTPLQEHQGNENGDQEDKQAQKVALVPEPPPLELLTIFISQRCKRKVAFVPTPPSLESFEIYINQKKNRSDDSYCPTDKSKADNAKIEATIVHKEMWRRADKLLAEDDWLTDTVLVVEETPIFVHRVVMATRSPVLAAMLEGGFKERDNREIRLPEISLEHFHTILEFIYTDKCLLDKANIPGVLELADRFHIQSLIDRCEEFLLWTFSSYDYTTLATHCKEQVGSIMESIYLSKTYNAEFLHKWCLHFVATNYSFFEGEEDFETVWAENVEFMEKNRWPSRKCSQLLDSYKKKCTRQKKCCVM